MKKTIQFLLVIGMLMVCPVGNVNAQSKAMNKALQKEYKSRKKELEKGKWEIFGSSRSIDVTLLKHYEQLNENENLIVVPGIVDNFSLKSIGRERALMNAQTAYANKCKAVISGRAINEMTSSTDDIEAEVEKFSAIYEKAVMKEMQNELTESYAIIRQTGKSDSGKPVYEMQIYFLVDNTAAKQVRLTAMQECLRESVALQKYKKELEKLASEDVTVD